MLPFSTYSIHRKEPSVPRFVYRSIDTADNEFAPRSARPLMRRFLMGFGWIREARCAIIRSDSSRRRCRSLA